MADRRFKRRYDNFSDLEGRFWRRVTRGIGVFIAICAVAWFIGKAVTR